MKGVRVLKEDELPLARIVLGKAFRDDPFVEFLLRDSIGPVPDRQMQEASAGRLFFELASLALEYGACYTAENFGCVALWRPPGHGLVPLASVLLRAHKMVSVFGFVGSFSVMRHLARLDARHPTEPHWYLQTLGTDPEKQGRGLGKATMLHHLQLVDEAHLPCYLECTKVRESSHCIRCVLLTRPSFQESNVSWYRQFGFDVVQDGVLTFEGGPSIWLMWRPSKGQ